MTRVYFHMPPEVESAGTAGGLGLEGTGGLCLPCMMFAKGDQVQATEAVWDEATRDGHDDRQKWIEYDAAKLGGPVRAACVMGVSDIPGMPSCLVPVCWDHLGALRRLQPDEAERRTIQPASVVPAAFGNGHGQPRRRR